MNTYIKHRIQNIRRMATRFTFTREVSVSVKSSYTNLQPTCHSPDGFFHEEFMTREAPTRKLIYKALMLYINYSGVGGSIAPSPYFKHSKYRSAGEMKM